MASRALQASDRSHGCRTFMLLMAHRTRPVLHHVRLVQNMLLVAALAFRIQRLKGNPMMETIVDYLPETFQRERTINYEPWIVTFLAIISEIRVCAGYRPRDEELLWASFLVNDNSYNRPSYDSCTDKKTSNAQPIYFAIIA